MEVSRLIWDYLLQVYFTNICLIYVSCKIIFKYMTSSSRCILKSSSLITQHSRNFGVILHQVILTW